MKKSFFYINPPRDTSRALYLASIFPPKIRLKSLKLFGLYFFIIAFAQTSCKDKNAEAYYNKGNEKNNLQDYNGAIADFNMAIESDPKYAFAYLNRGSAKEKLRDYQGAIADYDRAIELNTNYAIAFLNRGAAKYNIRDKEGACLDWSKAGELGNNVAYEYISKYCK